MENSNLRASVIALPSARPLTPLTLDLRTSTRSWRWSALTLLLACDLGGLWGAWSVAYTIHLWRGLDWTGLYLFMVLTLVGFMGLLGHYRNADRFPNLPRLWLGVLATFALIPPLHFGWDVFPQIGREAFFTAWAVALVSVPLTRMVLSMTVQRLRKLGWFPVEAFLVCSPERAALLRSWLDQEGRVLVQELTNPSSDDWEGLVEQILASGATEVIIDNWSTNESLLMLHQNLLAQGIRLRCLQGDGSLWPRGAFPQFFQGRPILEFEPPALFRVRFRLKRALDILASGLGLLLLAPFLGGIALLIKRDSPGPVFFTQTRVGVRGKVFKLFKFRSMYLDAEARKAALLDQNEGSGLLFKMKDDPRVTATGRWIRRYSLDELPQLINVFLGEMSLVGPRPALPSEVALYSPWQRQRLLVLPGITGLWQVSGRSDIKDFEDAVRCDLYYIQRWSISMDLTILWRTLAVVFQAKGAY